MPNQARVLITDPSNRWTQGDVYNVLTHDEVFGGFNQMFPDLAVEVERELEDIIWLQTEDGPMSFEPHEIEEIS